ncbi:hypothetical protein GF391_03810|nr:hypothetical protein [Candidatus Uhrbacteria bacterium]
MRDRDSQVGRPVKLGRKRKPLSENYLEWLKIAKADGEDFAPNLVELNRFELRHAFQDVRAKYKRVFRRHPGAYHSLMAVFHLALSEIILANKCQEEAWLVRKAFSLAIRAQNHLMTAFIQLESGGRLLLMDSWQHLDFNPAMFMPYCQSAMACARLAYAASKAGAKVRMATIENDMHHKIDLFFDHPMHGYPTLCVQVKSSAASKGARFVLLNETPVGSGLQRGEYKTQISVWRGVNKFNRLHNRDWVGVIAHVGTGGVPANLLEDPLVIAHTREFFNRLSGKTLSAYSLHNSSHPACA